MEAHRTELLLSSSAASLDFLWIDDMEACLPSTKRVSFACPAPGSLLQEGSAGSLRVMTDCVMQPVSARAKARSRNGTDLGLLRGQESSTSGLERMSSTQVSHTALGILFPEKATNHSRH